MKSRSTAVLFFTIFATTALVATAQSFMGLGDLPGGESASFARNLSADGSFVTGFATSDAGEEAFLWSEQTGLIGLGVPAGSDFSEAWAVSNAGSSVVGVHLPMFDAARAFQWTSGGGISNFDPFPVGALDRLALDTSATGDTIVGWYRPGDHAPNLAYHWQAGVLTPVLNSAVANAVSADGSVVVGSNLLNPNGPLPLVDEAFVWTAADGVYHLGFLPGGESGSSSAFGVSANGKVVVGSSDSANSTNAAFRWTESTGMVGLGDLPGGDFLSTAHDTTADGSIVVGQGNVISGPLPIIPEYDPFIWDEVHGMRNLIDVLINDYGLGDELAGWNLSEATAISDDGRVIIGNGINPDGNFEAWRAVLVPQPSAALLSSLAALGLLVGRRRQT